MAGVADRGDRPAFHYPPSAGLGEDQAGQLAEWTKLSREVSRGRPGARNDAATFSWTTFGTISS
jgi:hypothetical protein